MKKALTSKLKKIVRSNTTNRGFSLPDLLVGATLTTIVVGASGYGLAAMADASKTANSKSERRIEMNRSVDFISTEVRLAEKVSNKATCPDTAPPDCISLAKAKAHMDEVLNKPGNEAIKAEFNSQVYADTIKPVLSVKLPGSDRPVLYYAAAPQDGQWAGPKVIYRWGPKFDENGYYLNEDAWSNEPLVDKISSQDTSTASIGGAELAFSAPCATDSWTGSGEQGFYACVNPEENTAKIVQKSYIREGEAHSGVMTVSADVGTRGVQVKNNGVARFSEGAVAATTLVMPSSAPSTPPSTAPSTTTSPNLVLAKTNGDIVPNIASTMTVKLLGGQITCGAGGPRIPTSAKVKLSGGTTLTQSVPSVGEFTYSVSANTTINIMGEAKGDSGSGNCRSHYMAADSKTKQGTQVLTVLNGNTVPVFKPLGNQRNIKSFLGPYIDAATGKVKLKSNEAIFLFELGTTNQNSSAYDMQDLVVLVTLTPNQTVSSASTPTPTPTPTATPTSSTGTTSGTSNNAGCNNGLGNGSEGCTPGNARPNDEIVKDASGNILCTPAPGNTCTQASKSASGSSVPGKKN
jgi:hypothetical protein